jgi:hypothetical protein
LSETSKELDSQFTVYDVFNAMMKHYASTWLISAALLGTTLPAFAQTQAAPVAPQMIAQTDAVATLAQDFVGLLAAGDFETALTRYDNAVRTTLTPESLEQNWMDLTAVSGEFQQLLGVSVDTSGDNPLAIASCSFANGNYDIFVYFDNANQVIGFDAAAE